jgi:bifunctional enzyme CysN/CysC
MDRMSDELLSTNVEEYLRQHEQKGLLRFITCGSVDDGKSTLIGRMLYDSKLLFEDQLSTIEKDSKKWGTQGDEIDFALLVDGLAAEREQGITIDVAYRFFATERRKFIVADTPGHEQYTRNMVTGASTADAAVILVDARQGVLTQTRRHSYLVSLLGIRHVALAINKMDLVGLLAGPLRSHRRRLPAVRGEIGIQEFTPIPVSALKGENIVLPSAEMSWYHGPTLIGYLETVELDDDPHAGGAVPAAGAVGQPARLQLPRLLRPDLQRRDPARREDPRAALRAESTVARIVTYDGDLPQAVAGQSVTLTLTDEIDISRGAMISGADSPAQVADQFEAKVVWMADEQLIPGRNYLMKIGTQAVTASITDIKYQVNVNTLEHIAAKKLELNEIGFCNLSLDRPIAFDPYVENRDTGSFILIDRLNNNTVGAGMLDFALSRSQNIHLQHTDVDKAARAQLKGQKPCVLWFTGLSGSGKSTVANLVEKKLHAMGHHTYLLDGDNVRHGLNRDLGFTEEDRVENIRRVAEVAKLMVDAGLIVLTAFISPYRAERRMARQLFQEGEFIEVFMDTPLEVAERGTRRGCTRRPAAAS